MVKLTIKEACEARGITNAYQLQKAMSVQPSIASRLWRDGQKMVALETLDRLCVALDCKLSELIERDEEKAAKKGKGKI
jgi:DNA-binding Xre family transcriptional regulator